MQPEIRDEVTLVAEEIVRRIIQNAEIIGGFLSEAGYEFETPGPFVVAATDETAQSVCRIEEEFGDLPLFLKVWWSHVDHFNHVPSEEFFNARQGCPIEGIYPVGAILINCPEECLENSRQRAIGIRKHIEKANKAGITQEEYYATEPNLVLGPITSANDHIGYQLPLKAVDGCCHQTAEGEDQESLVDWLRHYFLKRGGLGWQFFGLVPTSDGGSEMRYFIRPQKEVDEIVQSFNLIKF